MTTLCCIVEATASTTWLRPLMHSKRWLNQPYNEYAENVICHRIQQCLSSQVMHCGLCLISYCCRCNKIEIASTMVTCSIMLALSGAWHVEFVLVHVQMLQYAMPQYSTAMMCFQACILQPYSLVSVKAMVPSMINCNCMWHQLSCLISSPHASICLLAM